MKFPWHISAGQLFELFRPAALLISALLSTWALASARRSGFRLLVSLSWAVGTFFLPFVTLPIYLIARGWRRPRGGLRQAPDPDTSASSAPTPHPVSHRFIVPLIYGALLLLGVGIYLYRDYNTVDAHLARAAQARLVGHAEKTISEYRAALALEDNPHTHKLLGIELANARQWAEAINEFRTAERGREPDELLPFRIGEALEATGQNPAAVREYQSFLRSHACTKVLPDERCAAVTTRVRSSSTILTR